MPPILPVAYHMPAPPHLRLASLHAPSTVCGNKCVNVYECGGL